MRRSRLSNRCRSPSDPCTALGLAYIRDERRPGRGDAAAPRSDMTYVDAALAPLRKTGQIKRYGPEAFAGMRKAGKLVAECLDMLADHVAPGVPTDEINRLVFEFAMDHGALPATLMYRGYNKSTCTSVNHVVLHGIP